MIKKPFKKSYANTSTDSYSKEYMDAYMAWRKTLTPKQIKSIEGCNCYIKGKNKKERNHNKYQTRNYYKGCKNPMP